MVLEMELGNHLLLLRLPSCPFLFIVCTLLLYPFFVLGNFLFPGLNVNLRYHLNEYKFFPFFLRELTLKNLLNPSSPVKFMLLFLCTMWMVLFHIVALNLILSSSGLTVSQGRISICCELIYFL